MNVHKKVTTWIALLIIVIFLIIASIVSFLTVSPCRYSPSAKNPNVLTFNVEPAPTVTACYFKWQCQLIESEEGRKVCEAKFNK